MICLNSKHISKVIVYFVTFIRSASFVRFFLDTVNRGTIRFLTIGIKKKEKFTIPPHLAKYKYVRK